MIYEYPNKGTGFKAWQKHWPQDCYYIINEVYKLDPETKVDYSHQVNSIKNRDRYEGRGDLYWHGNLVYKNVLIKHLNAIGPWRYLLNDSLPECQEIDDELTKVINQSYEMRQNILGKQKEYCSQIDQFMKIKIEEMKEEHIIKQRNEEIKALKLPNKEYDEYQNKWIHNRKYNLLRSMLPQSLRYAGQFSEKEMSKEMSALKAMYQDQLEQEDYQQNNIGSIIESINEGKNRINIKETYQNQINKIKEGEYGEEVKQNFLSRQDELDSMSTDIEKMEDILSDTFHHLKTVDLFNVKPHPTPYGRGSMDEQGKFINPPHHLRMPNNTRWYLKTHRPKIYDTQVKPKRGKKFTKWIQDYQDPLDVKSPRPKWDYKQEIFDDYRKYKLNKFDTTSQNSSQRFNVNMRKLDEVMSGKSDDRRDNKRPSGKQLMGKRSQRSHNNSNKGKQQNVKQDDIQLELD